MAVNIKEVLAKLSGNTFMAISTITTPKLSGGKKNPLNGRIKKRMTDACVQVFQNKASNGYANMVNRRLDKEGKEHEFVLSPRAWGERVAGMPIVTHKDKAYLEVIFHKPGAVDYLLDDNYFDVSQLEDFKVDDKIEGYQSGLEDKVIIRTFDLANVSAIKCLGEVYQGPFVYV